MRRPLVLLHRWLGLFMAVFLIVTGLTGAVISWDHELDEALNSHLIHASDGPVEQSRILSLMAEVERRHRSVQVSYLPLAIEEGHSISFWVEPRINPGTGRLFAVDYNQVFVDPITGKELGTRHWGSVWPIRRETFVSFLYKLHYSLHVPKMWGTDRVGVWLLGFVAIVWVIDSFIGAALTLPKRGTAKGKGTGPKKTWLSRWRPSWLIRVGKGAYRLNFDLHRAFGLWTWGLLFSLAVTAVCMNLSAEVVRPAVMAISDLTPSVWDQRTYVPDEKGHIPGKSFATVIALAEKEAERRGWQAPAGSIYYSSNYDVFGVSFFRPEDEHGVAGAGHPELRLDGQSGKILEAEVPWQGTTADIFMQAQFPIHSGRILGLPGRILISLMGLMVAMLSGTGILIWWKKRASRLRTATTRQTREASKEL